ncbi:MAG: hypothetical protein HUJ56_07040, partial [Erysipelotrichaceae bacterium]|nr:hypothetical protein [Erysipelotrichaceae bacterium]
MKQVYYFDEDKLFTYQTNADLDPLETQLAGHEVYLLPAQGTFVPVPEHTEKQIPKWTGTEWELIEDHRGEYYYPKGSNYESSPIEMKEIGVFPEGSTLERPEMTEEEKKEYNSFLKRSKKLTAIKDIIVTVDGMQFQADESSQTRISRAISVMSDTDTIDWILADNSVVSVTKAQLMQVLKLAVLEQTILW